MVKEGEDVGVLGLWKAAAGLRSPKRCAGGGAGGGGSGIPREKRERGRKEKEI